MLGLLLLASRRLSLKRSLVSLAPFALLVGVYMVMSSLIIGEAVGHYDIDVAALNPIALASTELKYLFKVVLLSRFWSFPDQTAVYSVLDSAIAGSLFLLVSVALVILLFKRDLAPRARMTIFAFGSAALLLLPVAHLYFYYLQFSENDRYSYLALAMFSMGLVSLLNPGKTRLRTAIAVVFLGLNCFLALTLAGYWNTSARIHDQMLSTFPKTMNNKYIALNTPDNYKGIYMFRNIGGSTAIEEPLHLFAGRENITVIDAVQYNMATPSDGVTAVFQDSSTVKLTFNQWGTWWWRNGMGASPVSNNLLDVSPQGQDCIVELSSKLSDYTLTYFDGEEWQILEPPARRN